MSENCTAHWRQCFSPILTIFKLIRDINKTNVLTKFHDDWAKKAFFYYINIRKTAPSPLASIFRNLNAKCDGKTDGQTDGQGHKNVTSRVFTCFHYIHIEKTAPPPGGHVFSPIWTIFELSFTRKHSPPTGGHVFQRTRTTFELKQHIIKTNILTNYKLDLGIIGANLLTKFHEERTRNVASRLFTNQMWTDGRRTKTNPKSTSEQLDELKKT
ncbi:hypothetical protein DPMN_148446 [Dreissena polymorpha]|uniref:Uncharacterized protein n=1 Tax=Dreissena polymorpha TaxID=45954 RepID=A0A9D4FE34_DREPO|nr:hypothetical protein DPMN_148446 [Dreissena polymorpha]